MATITAIATAVPDLDFEQDYRRWALARLGESREAKLFERMAQAARIGAEAGMLASRFRMVAARSLRCCGERGLNVPAGGVENFAGMVAHGANQTARPRLGVILEYAAGWLRRRRALASRPARNGRPRAAARRGRRAT